jgi:hypothetical protein
MLAQRLVAAAIERGGEVRKAIERLSFDSGSLKSDYEILDFLFSLEYEIFIGFDRDPTARHNLIYF